jgi:cardiolipin synthase
VAEDQITLLPSAASTLEAIEQDSARARSRVWIESFIVRDDRLGNRLLAWLSAARDRGVDARLLYDPLGCRSTPRAFFANFEASGVSVRGYRPLSFPLRASPRWPRDHARIFCLDDAAYVGGVAFGDEWLPSEAGGHGWHDVSCRVQGPIVRAFESVFERRWQSAHTSQNPQDMHAAAGDLLLMADAPAGREGIYARYRDRVQNARSRIWIENGYFFPPRRLLHDLGAAAHRGVDVQVILPAGSDVPLLASAARGEYSRWLRSGLRVHEYLPSMCHSKFALVDDDWASIGSYNLNPTSLMYTNECNLFVSDRRFVEELAKLFCDDRAQCRAVTMQRLRSRSVREKLTHAALRLGMRLLESVAWLTVGSARRLRRLMRWLRRAFHRA